MAEPNSLDGRCGSCARFVRVREELVGGKLQRIGDCLLGVWHSQLTELSTCAEYIKRGTVATSQGARKNPARPAAREQTRTPPAKGAKVDSIPEELLEMDAEEFRNVLRQVLREELGAGEVELGSRWVGGEVILKPGKEGTAEKKIPIDVFFSKIVMVRDKLRVLEQRINSHPQLTAEDKLHIQQYITQCYGTLTTFNILFSQRVDMFIGQKGQKED